MVGTKTSRTVTVEKRGMFDDDPFFKDSLDEWNNAMKTVVEKYPSDSNSKTSKTTTTTTTSSSRPVETRNVYRQIRSSNVTSDDSQAVSCTEENDKYKMMIDVKDFKPGDITVKTVDDTVVVEGKIEQKEGNSIKTQVFTRRFMLPATVNLNGVSSALSRDGVLTINAPKLAAHVTSGRPTSRTVEFRSVKPSSRLRPNLSSMPAAGKPSVPDGPDRRYLVHTPINDDGHHIVTTVMNDGTGHWSSFNDMVERSQREMEDMMRRHSLQSSSRELEVSTPSSALSRVPAGASTTRDVSVAGNNVTQREEKRWEDNPAPGLHRTNRVLNENTELKGADGSVVGNKKRSEQESHAEGSREVLMPDGSKKTTFTKSYETKKVYSYNSSDPKAV